MAMKVQISPSKMRLRMRRRSHSQMMVSTMRLTMVGKTGPPWVTPCLEKKPVAGHSPAHQDATVPKPLDKSAPRLEARLAVLKDLWAAVSVHDMIHIAQI